MIEVNDLSKSYKLYKNNEYYSGVRGFLKIRKKIDKLAVKNISFELKSGEIVGYIGANGAGKSTTIKLLTGVIKPSNGKISINGMSPNKHSKEFCKSIGVLYGQKSQLWWDLPVIDSFKLLSLIYGVSDSDFKTRLDYLVETLEIKELIDLPVRKLSLGQRMICDLAAVFIHNPKIVFLDEPTIGLDVSAKKKLHNTIKELNNRFGTTFIITSHDLYEIEALCSRILLINNGELVHDGSLSEFKRVNIEKHKVIQVEYEEIIDSSILIELENIKGLAYQMINDNIIEVKVESDDKLITKKVISKCLEFGNVLDIKFKTSDVNHIFTSYFSKSAV